jgi:SAM-dependent methyltransferase
MNPPLYATPPQVDDLGQCTFYHTLDIPGVGEVAGVYDLRQCLDAYLGPIALQGRRVLEIGPGSGFLTFAMEQRGAEVVAIELAEDKPWDYVPYDSPLLAAWLEEQKATMRRMRNGFWFAHRRLGSKARVHYGSAYDLPAALGRFDVAIMAAVLLHNRDPLGIIANCARITDRAIVIVDQYDAQLDGLHQPLLGFCPTRENRMVHTWWHLSPRLLREYLRCLGFEPAHFAVHTEQFAPEPGGPTQPQDHFTLIAERPARATP